METIIVLMSTYNGQKYLKEQLESLANQTIIDSDFELKLIVRDDGSSDDTLEIISSYASRMEVQIVKGKNIGPARSFWELLNIAPVASYYAFCDQDDVWFPEKLERALAELRKNDTNEALLYCSSVIWTDQLLTPLDFKNKTEVFHDFPHLLLYSIAPGCTFVFNNEARNIATKYSFDNNQIEIHDWLLSKIVAMFGKVHYDNTPTMYYRQHEKNVIGRNNFGFKGLIKRIKNNIKKNSGIRSEVAKSLINTYRNELSKQSKELYYLDLVANYKKSLKKRIQFIHEKRFRRKVSDTLLLMTLILFGKV